jgi:tRNA(Ile)-lysidine synthase
MRRAHPERGLESVLEKQKIAPKGATLLIACSGGPDSVALAGLLVRVAPRHAWRLVLGHVNHHLRESSWQDEAIVLSIAARLNLPVCITALDPAEVRTDEATLRDARYAALASLAREAGARVVVTAHVAEDQTETVLLALFRGTGMRGLRGIPVRRKLAEGIQIVRPLLQIGHEALEAELGASALPYVRDPTNTNIAYRRNAVREALAGLRGGFPRLDEAVARCAAIVAAELEEKGVAGARSRLRKTLESEVGLRDVSFERVEAALGARRGRVHIKRGVEVAKGEKSANTRVIRRKS